MRDLIIGSLVVMVLVIGLGLLLTDRLLRPLRQWPKPPMPWRGVRSR